MTTSRREFIAGTGAALAALSGLAACAKRSPAVQAVDSEALLSEVGEEMLADYPENATALGIDTGARAPLKARLTDRSAAGQAAIAKRVAARLARMKAVDAAALSEAARIDLDVVRTAHETAVEGFAFPYGDVATLNQNWSWRNAPYVVTQNTGAFLEIPSLLEEQHTVATKEDADAYLARLSAYAGQTRWRDRAPEVRGFAGRHRAGFHPRQGARPDQARAGGRRREVADDRLVREEGGVPRRRFRGAGGEARVRPDRPGARSPGRRARSASRARDGGRRRLEAARRAMPTTPGRCAPRRRRA